MNDAVAHTYPFVGKSWGQRIAVSLVALLPFALTVLAIVRLWGNHVTWLDLALLLVGYGITVLGITLGYHRMLTHGAFKARAPVRLALLAAGVTSLQGSPASWAATHRRHHALSDKDGDPHSPLEGFWHAHFGWLVKGNLVHSGPAYDQMLKDPVVRFMERTWLGWVALSIVVPGLIGLAAFGTWGAFFQAMLWGGIVRIFFVHHMTWSINSICHTWGTRPYKSPDVARNNGLFGWLGFGEGWHNNHHAFPKSAWLGHRWWQVDVGKYVLIGLRRLRLVTDVHVPSKPDRAARRRRAPSPGGIGAVAMVNEHRR